MLEYIENSEPIAVSTCYCRREALLIDESDVCGMPMEVCMQFDTYAEYLIERGMGRRVGKDEAMNILRQAEDAGLDHISLNMQRISFICNCCPCHYAILQEVAFRQSRPSEVVLHSYVPSFDSDLCTVCGTCIDRCPIETLILGSGDVLEWDEDRCIGCGVCASGSQEEAL